ncbi:putative phosphothreonine lyase domain-containing protein [Streptomyces sp. WZ-12]|uniref:putative phosphothreonine lyase domain-containing protein n=1 Tax=Streptomyces sp. WZ-12 TaxID=3030210 RepID=UPI002380DD9D|nr:putative phosphothreonine lyase domain-containg protein [Streptomyces sp. WZ-12]
MTADPPAVRAGLEELNSLGWIDRVRAPDDANEDFDEFGNEVTGKWMPKELTPELWERIRSATIEGDLGIGAKVLKDHSRACVYTRDYRDLDDLRRILTELRDIGARGWIDYKRDCDTQRELYGRGAAYSCSPPGTVDIKVPRWSVGREMDREAVVDADNLRRTSR